MLCQQNLKKMTDWLNSIRVGKKSVRYSTHSWWYQLNQSREIEDTVLLNRVLLSQRKRRKGILRSPATFLGISTYKEKRTVISSSKFDQFEM